MKLDRTLTILQENQLSFLAVQVVVVGEHNTAAVLLQVAAGLAGNFPVQGKDKHTLVRSCLC